MKSIFELLSKTSNLWIFAVICTVICFFAEYKQFDFLEYKDLRISFDFVYFFALVGSVVSWLILIKRALYWPIIKLINRYKISKLKEYWEHEYQELGEMEKTIVDFCLNRRTLVFEKGLYDGHNVVNAIYSLAIKGFGQNITYGSQFAMNKDCYEILKEYKSKCCKAGEKT